MKILAIFPLLLAVASSYPVVKLWTLSEVDMALRNPDPKMKPYYEEILNTIMLGLFRGDESTVMVLIPSPSNSYTWTVEELAAAIADPKTNKNFLPAIKRAYDQYLGGSENTKQVLVPAMDLSTWTESDLIKAVQSSSTHADLLPFVQKAIKELKAANRYGQKQKTIKMVTPVGLIRRKGDNKLAPIALKYVS